MGGGGGGEIPKGGRAGKARFLGIWPGGEIPRDLGPGGEIPGTPGISLYRGSLYWGSPVVQQLTL